MMANPAGSGPIHDTNRQVRPPSVVRTQSGRPSRRLDLRRGEEQHAVGRPVDDVIGAGGDPGLAEEGQPERTFPVVAAIGRIKETRWAGVHVGHAHVSAKSGWVKSIPPGQSVKGFSARPGE